METDNKLVENYSFKNNIFISRCDACCHFKCIPHLTELAASRKTRKLSKQVGCGA